jgi:hypothetical protein
MAKLATAKEGTSHAMIRPAHVDTLVKAWQGTRNIRNCVNASVGDLLAKGYNKAEIDAALDAVAPAPATFVSWSHQLATIYAQAGIQVFPFCFVSKAKPDGASKWDKVPMTPHGHKDATTNAAAIDGWSNLWADPTAGVGIPLSAIGHLALDGDLHGLGDGNAKLAQVRADFGINTGNRSVGTRTGSGGTHHILRLLPPFPPSLSKPKDWPVGVLDLVYNGWVVAPGSAAPDGSRWLPMLDGAVPLSQEQLVNYVVEWGRRVSGGLIELASPRLVAVLTAASSNAKSPDDCRLPNDLTIAEKAALQRWGGYEFERMLKALEGRVKGDGRSLVALAGCSDVAPLACAGLADEAVLRTRIDEVQPGLETEDNCVNNGFAKGNGKARMALAALRGDAGAIAEVQRNLGAYVALMGTASLSSEVADPSLTAGVLDVMPLPEFKSCPALAEIVEKAPHYGVDPSGAVNIAIGVACNIAATKLDVRSKGKAIGPHLHVVFAQESVGGKSTIFGALIRKPKAILEAKAADLQAAADNFEAVYSAFKEHTRKESKSTVAAVPATALFPKRTMSADATPQVVVADLQVTAPPVLIVSAELSQLFEAASVDHAKPLASLIINSADGELPERARISDRKVEGVSAKEANRANARVEAGRTCRLGIVGALQTGAWQEVTKGNHGKHFDHRGMVARLLLVAPTTTIRLSERAALDRADRDDRDAFPLATAALCEMAAGFDLMIGRTSAYANHYWPSQAEAPPADTARGFLMKHKAERAAAVGSFPWEGYHAPPPRGVVGVLPSAPDYGASVGAPQLPAGVLLGGDTMHRHVLRLTEADEAALWQREKAFQRQCEAGQFGMYTPALKATVGRVVEKVFKIAAAIHAINEREALERLGSTAGDREAAVLTIPAAVVDDAWTLVMHVLTGALNAELLGHRAKGRESLREAKERALDSPTAESETAGRAADGRAVLLKRLASQPQGMTAREVYDTLSKGQRELFKEGVTKTFVQLVAEGTVAADREGDGAIYTLAQK